MSNSHPLIAEIGHRAFERMFKGRREEGHNEIYFSQMEKLAEEGNFTAQVLSLPV